MSTLPELRKAIDAVDDELLRLLNERARLVKSVGALKAALAQPFYVPHRERQIVERLQEMNAGPFPTEALRAVFSEVISACLSLEHPLRVAFLGPEATFTHMAARSRFGLSARYVPAATIAGVFGEVDRGLADLAVVPIENSTEGVVNSTLDVFMDSDALISAEIVLEVSHCLLDRSGTLDGIQKVYSHPQALAQCRGWLSANLPKAALIEVASTALAARLAKDDPVAAAVASELAGQLYDLRIAKAKIEDEAKNVTRFLVIGRQAAVRTGRDKTSLMLSVKDQSGVLYKMLGPLAERGINLTRIESRPSRRRAWDYVFFIDLDGHIDDEPVAKAVEGLRGACEHVKVLGSYPRADQPEQP
ncbi:MAG TPA: prephenate dehydratase [Polyangia bacterium]